ncbi:hypothetical protein EGJ28_23285 [Stutzerimonas xanthomarina]|uniref:Uncharacterized protein n=1 Tax=Stutzerimonas xanthomarina TaxID=271420 RepID=A0A3R8U2S6_9GAMM|nr:MULTISPECIES: hypothetical protein [Stutzerimonas]KIL03230.1 hypothetical protein QX25_18855 [Stutzerimonas stutzeri]MBK3920055.1 hypothetical protein [Stutzerimonas frequens]RRV03820.1 hypothetical protein EGJ28_23285 [Stutzerimonas xanthomarina]
MQYDNRKSNAGLVIWGDIYELKNLWAFIHRVLDESTLLDEEDQLLTSLAYEVRHAFDRLRHKSVRKWYGEDSTPIYGFDCLWPVALMQLGRLRAGLAFMPTVTRHDQSVMYGLESVVLNGLEDMLPGTSEQLIKMALRFAHEDADTVDSTLDSRTGYFLSLTPKKRKDNLAAIFDSIGTVWARDNPLDPIVFEPFLGLSEYPSFKW